MLINTIKEFVEQIETVKLNFNISDALLYRGQADCEWKVMSSLEQLGINEISCNDYYLYVDKIKPLINPRIKHKFLRKATAGGYPFNFTDYDQGSWSLPDIEYITYLRHHGFPTPLIDWTKSPYIALFFACEDFSKSKNNGKVFIFTEKTQIKVRGNNKPELRKIGHYLETDKRHMTQQSSYIIPLLCENEWKFIEFTKAINANNDTYGIYEIEIANSAKRSIIKELHTMNINRYTVYLDEDSLIKNYGDLFAMENQKRTVNGT